MSLLTELREEIKRTGNPEKAVFFQRFFKTGVGQYGYGDIFLGLTVPQSRLIARKYNDLPLTDIEKLLSSLFHEERLIALLILLQKFKKGDRYVHEEIYTFYLHHTKNINNWDLVDLTAAHIVGGYLYKNTNVPRQVLSKLARSENLWERRIAIISTYAFIIHGEYEETFRIATILLNDKEDLIHKAVGWMLREVGKRVSREVEEEFLKRHYNSMPRTALRYAIEHFPESRRKQYLSGTI